MRHMDKVSGKSMEKNEKRTFAGKLESRLDTLRDPSTHEQGEEASEEEYGIDNGFVSIGNVWRGNVNVTGTMEGFHVEGASGDGSSVPQMRTGQQRESVKAKWEKSKVKGVCKEKERKKTRDDKKRQLNVADGGEVDWKSEAGFSFSDQKMGEEKKGRNGTSETGMKRKSSYMDKYIKVTTLKHIADHEVKSQYDPEERKRNAVIESIAGKAKSKMYGAGIQAGKMLGSAATRLFQKAFLVLAPLLPYFIVLLLFVSVVAVVIGAFIIDQEKDDNKGHFGKMYYWIEYETGKTDNSAFATVLGDGGKAFGIQFDYRYALQPFMCYCCGRDPIAYSAFAPYLYIDKGSLLGNQGLAAAWISIFDGNQKDFIEDQKTYARMNYYDGIERQAEQYGIRLKGRDDVCKGAVLSYSFQCGSSAAYSAVEQLKDTEGDKEFLENIYKIRTSEYPSFADRYVREYQTALGLLEGRDFEPPVDMTKCMVTSEFGEYRSPSDPAHKGTDFGSYGGAHVPTMAVADGKVTIAGYSASAGNWVVIDHGNGIVSKYMHNDSICVSVGQEVKKGQQIGIMGETGQAFGVHLHLQIELDGTPVNARDYISF